MDLNELMNAYESMSENDKEVFRKAVVYPVKVKNNGYCLNYDGIGTFHSQTLDGIKKTMIAEIYREIGMIGSDEIFQKRSYMESMRGDPSDRFNVDYVGGKVEDCEAIESTAEMNELYRYLGSNDELGYCYTLTSVRYTVDIIASISPKELKWNGLNIDDLYDEISKKENEILFGEVKKKCFNIDYKENQ